MLTAPATGRGRGATPSAPKTRAAERRRATGQAEGGHGRSPLGVGCQEAERLVDDGQGVRPRRRSSPRARRARCAAGRRARSSDRARRSGVPGAGCGKAVERAVWKADAALHLLLDLVDVAVEHGDRAEPRQQRQRLGRIVRAPAPVADRAPRAGCGRRPRSASRRARRRDRPSARPADRRPRLPMPPAFRLSTLTRATKCTPPWSKLYQPAPLVPLP